MFGLIIFHFLLCILIFKISKCLDISQVLPTVLAQRMHQNLTILVPASHNREYFGRYGQES